jgi:Na+/proline symporter
MTAKIVISVITVYFIVLLIVSYFTGKNADNEGFFLGNRRSPWYIVAFGMISASLSGVTFISVPGWVLDSNFYYMQMVLGYLLGYFIIANVLMPLYYRMNLTSIYGYLESRFGSRSYKTGSVMFLISRIIGASFRLFLVANVLQITLFDSLKIPFEVTVVITILLIWVYTFRGGIKTIIWTDSLQTVFMLLAAGLTIYYISNDLGLGLNDLVNKVSQHEMSTVWNFTDWKSGKHFSKMFLSGVLISVVMTGLDQDMMQKNLSCKNIGEAKKNMYWFSIALVPVNLLFLTMGVMFVMFAARHGMAIPENGDDMFSLVATHPALPVSVLVFFIFGLVAAAYSSADSALTALTTSFTMDILDGGKLPERRLTLLRRYVHVFISALLVLVIIVFNKVNDQSVVDRLFYIAGFTYGPLLGLYAFGILTGMKVKDRYVPVVAFLAPVVSYVVSVVLKNSYGYKTGYEILLINGILTFIGLISIKKIK